MHHGARETDSRAQCMVHKVMFEAGKTFEGLNHSDRQRHQDAIDEKANDEFVIPHLLHHAGMSSDLEPCDTVYESSLSLSLCLKKQCFFYKQLLPKQFTVCYYFQPRCARLGVGWRFRFSGTSSPVVSFDLSPCIRQYV